MKTAVSSRPSKVGLALIGTLGTLLAVALIVKKSRVRYEDGCYLVAVRSPGEWHDIREFVQPSDPAIAEIGAQIPNNSLLCLDWVCRNIEYLASIGEFWRFPGEVLADGYGDCNDKAFVLASLVRRFANAYVVLGKAAGGGHAWVTDESGFIYEVTYSQALPVDDPSQYHPYALFNDEEVIEEYPGALEDILESILVRRP